MVPNTQQLCLCGLRTDHITEYAFQCFANSEQQVTFRAKLHGTAQATSSQLLTNIETWVARTDTTITIQGVRVHIDSSCPLAISSFGDPECTTAVPPVSTQLTPGTENITSTSDYTITEPAQLDNAGSIVGGVVPVIVVTVLAVTIIAIAILVIRNHKSGSSIDQDKG